MVMSRFLALGDKLRCPIRITVRGMGPRGQFKCKESYSSGSTQEYKLQYSQKLTEIVRRECREM